MKENNFEPTDICSCAVTISILSSKWKVLIMRELLKGTIRFSDLRRNVVGISQKMLTQSLKEMETDGLVHRHVFPEVPPRVEYSLTEIGESLRPVIKVLDDWGSEFIKDNKPDYLRERFNINVEQNNWMKIPDSEK